MHRYILKRVLLAIPTFLGITLVAFLVIQMAPGDPAIQYRRLQIGDRANLWTYLDWMLSASSNAAASMVIRELMLLVHFGKNYPVEPE